MDSLLIGFAYRAECTTERRLQICRSLTRELYEVTNQMVSMTICFLYVLVFSTVEWPNKPKKEKKKKKEKDFLPRSAIARRVARQPPFRAKWRGFWLDVLETNIEYGRLYRDSRSDPRQWPNVPDCPQQSNFRMARLHLALKGRPIKSFYICFFFFLNTQIDRRQLRTFFETDENSGVVGRRTEITA